METKTKIISSKPINTPSHSDYKKIVNEFEELINSYLKDGWELRGNIFTTDISTRVVILNQQITKTIF